METDRAKNINNNKVHNEFNELFAGIGCFKGTFSFKVKEEAIPYQVPSKHVALALQKTFKKSYRDYMNKKILAPIGLDKTAEWYNSSVIVAKPKGSV